MEDAAITALLVEDDPDEVLLMRQAISDAGATDITLNHCDGLQDAIKHLGENTVDAVLLDLSLPDTIGLEGVAPIVQAAGEAAVIVCTGLDDQDKAQEAIRDGAQDYLVKNPRLYGAIPRILRYAVERNRLIHAANKKVEQARQYTELLLTKVISIANSGLGITDGNGNFVLVNPALARLADCPQAELIGKPWTNLLPEKIRKKEHAAYVNSFRNDADYDHDKLAIQTKGGTIVTVPMQSIFVDFASNRSCRVLSFGGPPPTDAGQQAQPPGTKFGDRLKKRVGNGAKKLAAGRLQIIGLDKIQAELGDRWQALFERVYAMAERTIEKRLSPGDTYTRNKEGAFIICFDRLSEQEASFKAQALSREIREKILGTGDINEIDDFGIDSDLLSDAAEITTETHTLKVDPEEFEDLPEVATLITQKINKAAEQARAKTKVMVAEIHKTARTRLREVQKRDHTATSFMMHGFDPDTRLRVAKLMNIASDDPKIAAEIDYIALGSTVRYIHDLSGSKIPLIVVDVHYSTIMDKLLFNDYNTICRGLDKRVTMSLVFNIKDFPPNTHTNNLTAASAALSPFSRLRMIQPRRLDVSGLDLREARVSFVAARYDTVIHAYYNDPEKCKERVNAVHEAGARMLIDAVTCRDGRHLFRDLGVDFISYQPATELDQWITSRENERAATG